MSEQSGEVARMGNNLAVLVSFMAQLGVSSMDSSTIAARGYDYALMMCRADEEPRYQRGEELPALLQLQMMDRAADLLKFAMEKLHEPKAKHDGNLDDRDSHHSYHAGVELQEDYGACDGSKVVYIHGGHGDCESSSMYLDLKQALSLLSWLQQEKSMLARLIQEVPRERE